MYPDAKHSFFLFLRLGNASNPLLHSETIRKSVEPDDMHIQISRSVSVYIHNPFDSNRGEDVSQSNSASLGVFSTARREWTIKP